MSIVFDKPLNVAVALETWLDFVVNGRGRVVVPNCHCASCVPATHGTGVTDPAVSAAVANLVVSVAPAKRWADVFRYVPPAGAVTFTLIVQVPPAATVPDKNEIDPAPAAGENVGEPQPAVDAAGVAATTIAPDEVGNVSVKLRAPIAADVGLLIVNVSVETLPAAMGLG